MNYTDLIVGQIYRGQVDGDYSGYWVFKYTPSGDRHFGLAYRSDTKNICEIVLYNLAGKHWKFKAASYEEKLLIYRKDIVYELY